MANTELLHPERYDRIPLTGRLIAGMLTRRAAMIEQLTEDLTDPPLSIVIRTQNNEALLPELFESIHQQVYDAPVEIIVVDTESTDRTVALAQAAGARIITIEQKTFSYPAGLNVGFAAARSPYVMSIAGHSALASRHSFKPVTYWAAQPAFGGLYGTPLPNWNASWVERAAIGLGIPGRFGKSKFMKASTMGLLGANAAIIKRSAWEELGGFDLAYAAGGEDSALGKKMLAAGMFVVREPICAVFHSHNLTFKQAWHQFHYWRSLAQPCAFDRQELENFRTDLRAE